MRGAIPRLPLARRGENVTPVLLGALAAAEAACGMPTNLAYFMREFHAVL